MENKNKMSSIIKENNFIQQSLESTDISIFSTVRKEDIMKTTKRDKIKSPSMYNVSQTLYHKLHPSFIKKIQLQS